MSNNMEWYIGTEWQIERKGLTKRVLDLKFTKLEKPHQVAKVVVELQCENLYGRESLYLSEDKKAQDQCMEMGTALSPVDYYLEMMVQQMLVGEKALCTIKTKKSEEDLFITVSLKEIEQSKEIETLTVSEIYSLALKYKENGVKMFKTYPVFAHEYFAKAAKCLISYKKFEVLEEKIDGVNGKDMNELLIQIQTNLAACLLNAKRYEDVIYHTNHVEAATLPSEKSIYRRAMAYHQLKEYDLAQSTIERLANYKDNRELHSLHEKINASRKNSDDQYKGMVRKMFV